jgi:transmembrane sensor
MSNDPKLLPDTIEQAIDWHVRLTSGDEGERDWQAFTVWLEANPEHRLAYTRVEEFSRSVIKPTSSPTGHEAPRIWFHKTGAARRSPYPWVVSAIALAAVLILFVMIPNRQPQARSVEYSTRIGETRSVRLADGSTADLNTDTRLTVTIGETQRRASLAEGEVLFHVAKDAARPFDVLFGHDSLRVVGTVFDVLHTGQKSSITVAQGKVRFLRGARASLLVAGDQLVYGSDTGPRIRHVDPSAASAWRKGYLIYDNATLAEIVADLNRYFTRKIVIVEIAAARQRFSGALRVDGERSVVDRLSHLLPVRPDYDHRGAIVLRGSSNKD